MKRQVGADLEKIGDFVLQKGSRAEFRSPTPQHQKEDWEKSRVNSTLLFLMNRAQSLYRVLFLKKILQLCMKLNSHVISQSFFLFFFVCFFLLVWGGLVWRWVKHGYLAEHCPFKNMFGISGALEGEGNHPSLANVLRLSSSRVLLRVKWEFWDKSFARHWFLKSNTHACPPKEKKTKHKTGTKNTSNTEFKSMYTSEILKTAPN